MVSARAATVYELEGEWAAGTPSVVETDDIVSARWWFNLNDDKPAPSNDPVDDVTLSIGAQGAVFDSIPPVCLTTGVSPASAILDGGATLRCNVGTRDQGSAVTLETPMRVTAVTGEDVAVTGELAGVAQPLPLLTVENSFLLDIHWGSTVSTFSYQEGGYRYGVFNWTLFHGANSPAGPATVSYDLTITNSLGAAMVVGPDACRPFTSGAATNHPWSGVADKPGQTAPDVTCSFTKVSGDVYRLTLSNIDYSHAVVPTRDSAGTLLPTDRVAVASGQVQLRLTTTQSAGNVSLSASTPTYTSVDGQTFQDLSENNTSSGNWTSGVWYNGWRSWHTGPALPSWNAEYYVSAGTEVLAVTEVIYPNVTNIGAAQGGLCVVLDYKYSRLTNPSTVVFGRGPTAEPQTGFTVEYYTGSSNLFDTADGSATYDPNAFNCTQTPGTWTANPSDWDDVKAVRTRFTLTDTIKQNAVGLLVPQTILESTPAGQDVWTWGAYMGSGVANPWFHPNRSMNPADVPVAGTATPGLRYPYAAGGRDVVKIVGARPVVAKSATPDVVDPGGIVTYTIAYSASSPSATVPTVDGYSIVDTLPVDMTYVPGSAPSEPTITTSDGRQVLTWVLDDVPVNTPLTMSFDAEVPMDAVGGSRLVNDVTAAVASGSPTSATASVVVNNAGFTQITKTADQVYLPNLDGDGDGDGSWTILVKSEDAVPQDFIDLIDILPHHGDQRGTSFAGSYRLSGPVTVDAPGTVYYTTADPAGLSDDPAHPSNGAAGTLSGNSVGWTTAFDADATAVRVITGALAPRGELRVTVPIETEGFEAGDVLVNRAQGRAENTRLVMRTSAPTTMSQFYAANLKKEVQDSGGVWRDANDPLDYPTFRVGDTVRYRVTVTNTGQGTLRDVVVSDDEQPVLGGFTIAELASGESESHVYEVVIGETGATEIVNTACAEIAQPADSTVPVTVNCDPAGIKLVGEVTHTKLVEAVTPIGGGQMRVDYRIDVTNAFEQPATYSLDDELRFPGVVTIDTASVTAPAGITLDSPAWDGRTVTRLVTDAMHPGGDVAHVYEVSVVVDVPMQVPGAGSANDPTVCPAPGSDARSGFNNVSRLTGADGATEDDQACAPMPSIRTVKRLAGNPVPNGDGTYTGHYVIAVVNDGGGAGTYDVTDAATPHGDLTILDVVLGSSPTGTAVNETWVENASGVWENTIASDVQLAPGEEHEYRVEVTFEVAGAADGLPVVGACTADPAAAPGGLTNVGTVTSNGHETEDDACMTVGYIIVDKTVRAGPSEIGDGRYAIEYTITATNEGGAPGDYTLTDQLGLGDGLTVESLTVTGPSGIAINGAFTGQGATMTDPVNRVTQDAAVTLAAGATHEFVLRLEVTMDASATGPGDLRCIDGAGGLGNKANAASNGIITESTACASLPLLSMTKELVEAPSAVGDGMWSLAYKLTVGNRGHAVGDYVLVDRLDLGPGIVVESAALLQGGVDDPEPSSTWTGQGPEGGPENVVVETAIGAGDEHVYVVELTVSLDREVVTENALVCSESGPGGLANRASLTHNDQVTTDDACASLPLIDIAKSVHGAVSPVTGEPGSYDVTYVLTVTNRGAERGYYDLDDALAPGAGVTVLGVQEVTRDVVGGRPLNTDFDGVDNHRIVSDEEIAAGAEHSYFVTVRYAVDLADIDVPSAGDSCVAGGETVPGALANTATVTWNGFEDDDAACVRPGKPTLDKRLISAHPAGEGLWDVVYEITVGNVGNEATRYDLDDEFRFATGVEVRSISVTGPAGVAVDEAFDGANEQRIASDVLLPGLDDPDYAPHVYRVAVTVGVPLQLPVTTVEGGPRCTEPDGSNQLAQGLNNVATLTDESGGTTSDSDCASLPSIDIVKEALGEPQFDGDTWRIGYEITVTNNGGVAGEYTLTDRLRLGAGIDVVAAVVTALPDGVAPWPGWTGTGPEGATENVVAGDVSLPAGESHVFRIELEARVDQDQVAESTYECSADGTGGFANEAAVSHNDLRETDRTCPVPEEPEPVDQPDPGDDTEVPDEGEEEPGDRDDDDEAPGDDDEAPGEDDEAPGEDDDDLAVTGAQILGLGALAAALLVVGGLVVASVRSRRD